MKFEEAEEILQGTRIPYEFQLPMSEPKKLIINKEEILFHNSKAFIKYRTHDNCPECGSPTNWSEETKEITKSDLEEFVESYEERSLI